MGNTALSAVLSRSDAIEKKPVKAKRGVNTHLGALTSLARSERDATESDIVELSPADIDFSDEINHRQQAWLSDDNKDFQKLVEGIALAGQKLPIMVRPKDDGRYELIYGSRRRQVALHLGIKVKALVANGVSDNDAHELAILENTNHSGLSPIEEARAVLSYKERNAPISDKDVAVVFTKSRQWVGFQMSLANIDPMFIEQCSNPWTITERGTRDFRTQWNNNKTKRDKWTKKLHQMKEQGKQLPYKKLIDQLTGEKDQPELDIIKDKKGRVVAEVSGVSVKNGRRVRRICIYEDFDKARIINLVDSLVIDFDG